MKEIIEKLPEVTKADYLLDTCFLLYFAANNRLKKLKEFCENHKVAISSFNAEEIEHVQKKIAGPTTHHLRDFLKTAKLSLIKTPVHPGNMEAEKDYVVKFDNEVAKAVPDPSDAVLLVEALRTGATLLTKDKHHLFTAAVENLSDDYNVEVIKELPRD